MVEPAHTWLRPSPSLVAGVVGGLYGVFVLLLLAPWGFDPAALIHAGRERTNGGPLPPDSRVIREGEGYDGQYNYRFAVHPFSLEEHAAGIALDLPAYRQQRTLYPLLAWVASLGLASLVPATLVLVNLAALAGLAFAAASIASARRHSAWWGGAIAAAPGLAVSVAYDLGEPVMIACTLLGLWLLARGAVWWASVSLCAAVLSHEHAVLVVAALALVSLATDTGDHPEIPVRVWLPAGIVFVAWQAYLQWSWGVAPVWAAAAFVGGPVEGIVGAMRVLVRDPSLVSRVILLEILATCGVYLGVLLALPTTRIGPAVCLAWGLSTGLALMGVSALWQSDLAFWRMVALPGCLGMLVLMHSAAPARRGIVVVSLGLWLLMVTRLVWTGWRDAGAILASMPAHIVAPS